MVSTASLHAAPPAPAPTAEDIAAKDQEHHKGSEKLSQRQDELAADVQQLALEQTVQKVIDMLKDCEDIMGEATDRLGKHDTGGETIAAQTEVIEKIYEAAKEKQKQQGQGQAGSAMMDMMERMMGKTPEGDGQGPGKKDGEASDQGGAGKHGDSDSANNTVAGGGDGKQEQRRVPKAAGVAGKALPEEFRGALDAYNRGAEKLAK